MKPQLFLVFLLSVVLALSAAAQQRQAFSDLNGALPGAEVTGRDPILSPWGLDNVTWMQVGSALHAFDRAGSGVLGNYFCCFGSDNGFWAQAMNLTTQTWANSTTPPYSQDNYAGVATDDAIYLIGRWVPFTQQYGNQVQKFTPSGTGPTGSWTQMAPYPISACGIAAAWDEGNYIYAAGGNSSMGVLSQAYRYDIATDSWSPIQSLPFGMVYAGGALVNGRFYVLGGVYSSNTLMEYDPGNNSWTQKTSLPTAVYFATFSSTFNSSYVFSVGGGGDYGGWPSTNAVQVYDPSANSWSLETPLPAAWGCNSARFAPPDKVYSAGGCNYPSYTAATYCGTGFPTGGPPPDISILMEPVNPPIIIPPAGGSFDYNATLTNNETGPASFAAWVMVYLPNGSQYGPVLGPANLTLPGGASITRLRSQSVPATAPVGVYTYVGYVGFYPNAITDSSYFTFEKSAAGDGIALIGDWQSSGGAFEAATETATPAECALLSNYPNPFNPTTAISYQLQDAGRVSLRVYNTAGKLVSTLVDGWRDAGSHEVTFEGSLLPSGIYVYRLEAGSFSASGKMVLVK